MPTILTCGARADVRKMAASEQVVPVARGKVRGTEGRTAAGEGTGGRSGPTVVLNQNGMPARGGLTILVPKLGKTQRWDEWMWTELRDGGRLKAYLDLEKRMSELRLREVQRAMQGFEQNNRSDFQLKAAVPMREYMRWKREDPHFFEDDGNLRSLKRDNPDAFVRC